MRLPGAIFAINSSCAGVSRPAVFSSAKSNATVKWCMVPATPRDGEYDDIARITRTALSASAPAPPYSGGTSRPGPPNLRNTPSTGPSAVSASHKGISASARHMPG